MKISVVTGIVFAFFLSGCATQYNNGKMGATGGVEAQFITNDTARISSRGNAFTDRTRIFEFVLLKAAETAVENGYTHFAIIESADASKMGSITTPGSAQTSIYGNTAYTTYSPGSTTNYIKPGQDTLVRFCKGQCTGMMRASEVISNLGSKYHTTG